MTNKGVTRCSWCGDDPSYVAYHDEEWGVPVRSRQALFELMVLESMQAGLSWLTILRKRAHMRECFRSFNIDYLANAGGDDVDRWMEDAGLIRNRAKLEAMVSNARLTQAREDFVAWLWSFAPETSPSYRERAEVPAHTPASAAMSKSLKGEGYKFMGPTVCYALMQSAGMVNDHLTGCFRFQPCNALRNAER